MEYKKKIIMKWMGRYLDREKKYKITSLRKIPRIHKCEVRCPSWPPVRRVLMTFEYLKFWGYIGIEYTGKIIK